MKMKHTANPLYMQKILMDGKEFEMPIKKEAMSVNDVIVIETAASDNIRPMRSGKPILTVVRRHAANITNVSSIPTAVRETNMFSTMVSMLVVMKYCRVLTYRSSKMAQQDSNR